ncbi:LacI family DNA-binding transcriptional regulator [Pedobacter sp.]|uniref:LacI family DNA-binding transcriptional regulator n=1 Tax=Pedobacter sp. TaxID=1411316 RepID=UPI003D7FAB78
MKKKTTIYDIAKVLGVNVATVSRALSGFPAISEATRKAVEETALALNYSPNKLAAALKSGKTYIIGIIVPSIQSHFFASIINSIEEGLKNSGYRVILYQTNESVESEIKGVKTLLEARVDGIMASLSLQTKDVAHFEEVVVQNIPLILFDRVSPLLDVSTITMDDYKAGYMAAQFLLDQGYQKIAFVTTGRQVNIFTERVRGYKAALEESGLPIIPEHIILGGLSIKDGRYAAGTLLRGKNPPDAIIAGDDFTALGVIKKLKESGIMPPEIGVIGFANEVFSGYITPNLTSIDQHPNQMGAACAELFLKMIKQKNPYELLEHTVLEPTVVERQSTAKK